MAEDMENVEEMLEGDQIPTREDLLNMLDSEELSEDMKEMLRNMLQGGGGGGAPQIFGGYGTILAVFFAFLIFSVIFFFGYKLYKSIKDKEVKREEKKKAKQMKKKK